MFFYHVWPISHVWCRLHIFSHVKTAFIMSNNACFHRIDCWKMKKLLHVSELSCLLPKNECHVLSSKVRFHLPVHLLILFLGTYILRIDKCCNTCGVSAYLKTPTVACTLGRYFYLVTKIQSLLWLSPSHTFTYICKIGIGLLLVQKKKPHIILIQAEGCISRTKM